MKAKELAQLLGVSPATVSLVLNNKPGISDSLRASLLGKIRDLGCGNMIRCQEGCDPKDDAALSAARSGRPQVVLYLIYTGLEDPSHWEFAFFPQVLRGAGAEARENGWELVVLHMDPSGGDLSSLSAYADRAVGVIAQVSRADQVDLHRMRALGLPVVFVDTYRREKEASSVCVNNEQGMFRVVEYLKEKGHRRIGYVYGCETDSMDERRGCFCRALVELGLLDSLQKENEFFFPEDCDSPWETLEQSFRSTAHLPTALVCENDNAALHALRALKAVGLRVPEDVSLVGFDNRPLCSLTDPPLTSVKNDPDLMGRACVLLLQDLRRLMRLNTTPSLKMELPTQLVERQSVRDLT